jgi:hypothetical protein
MTSLNKNFIVALAAGFVLATFLFSSPRKCGGGEDAPATAVAVKNIGTKTLKSVSVSFGNHTLQWESIPPDGTKTNPDYNKPLAYDATVAAKVESEGAFEKVVSLRPWKDIPRAKIKKIVFEINGDGKEVFVYFRLL